MFYVQSLSLCCQVWGERTALETLAKYDDDEFVREAASLYLLQTAAHDGQL
jgi:hypothetical protein